MGFTNAGHGPWARVVLFLPALLSCVLCASIPAQAQQTVTTVAGNGGASFSGDGGPATAASFNSITGVAVDSTGNIYVSDGGSHRVRKISTNGIITTIAGDGSQSAGGDGGLATQTGLGYPYGLAVDADGNVYIADFGQHRVRKVSPAGIITTAAGTGFPGFSGDGGPATSANLSQPNGLAVDANGNLYIGEDGNHRIRKVSAGGTISLLMGNGQIGNTGDEGPATQAQMVYARGITVDAAGVVYFADGFHGRIRKITPDGIVHLVAGTSTGFSGDGGAATLAQLGGPDGIVAYPDGSLYFVDSYNSRVRRISASGIITTVAGNGVAGFSGDGGAPLQASFNFPEMLAATNGKLYVADTNNGRLRLITLPASTPPGAPVIGEALAGNTQASVVFSAPGESGGAPISGYTVSSSPAGGVDSDAGTTKLMHLMTGLNNGTSYQFSVAATNDIGTSASSALSNSVTPAAVPGPPVIGTAVASNAQADVSFTPPANSGSGPITGYTVTSNPADGSDSNAGSTSLTHTMVGLQNRTGYTFTVRATNSTGTGLASAPSNAVLPMRLPGAPLDVSASIGSQANAAFVTYSPPLDYGDGISGFRVTSIPAGGVDYSAGQLGPGHAVGGLVAGTSYTFTVQALYFENEGPASAPSNAVIPFAVPGAPTSVVATAGDASGTVSFVAPANDGGRPVTGYVVQSSSGNMTDLDAGSPNLTHRVSLVNNLNYTFQVKAMNVGGYGPLSNASNVVTPLAVPPFVPTMSIGDVTITEGNAGAKYAEFTVSLSAPTTVGVGFIISTAEVNAVGNDDFEHYYSSPRTISPGETSAKLQLVIFGDDVVEADETFEVLVENVTNATLVDGIAIGTIVNDDAGPSPSLLVGDVVVDEGNSGSKTATITVQLSQASASAVSFNISTANGSATAGSDYTALGLNGQTIAAGQIYKTFSIAINGDTTKEADETFAVNLSNASGAVIARGQAVATIANDDNVSPVKIYVGDVYHTEGNSGTRTATFYVGLTQAAASAVTFDIKTEDSTAIAGSDYVAKALTGQTIAAGQTSTTFTVAVNGDTTPEGEERFIVTLGNISTNAALMFKDPHGVASFPNDDAVISLGDAAYVEGQSGTSRFAFPVTLSAPISDRTSFQLITCDGTATPYADYYPESGRQYLTYMNPGVTSMNVYVEVVGDTEVEPDETFCLELAEVSGAAPGDVHAEATILNDDLGPPTVTIGNALILEGDSDVRAMNFPVTLSHPAPSSMFISYHTESCGGTAQPDVAVPFQYGDYIPVSGSGYISTGNNVSFSLQATVRGDTVVEPDEQFCMVIDSLTGAVLANNTATGTIFNDDVPPSLSITDVSIAEGNAGTKTATFTVSLSKVVASAVIFDLATGIGTAAPGEDFVAASFVGQIMPPGQTSLNYAVTINGDTEIEGNETFTVNLNNVTGAPVSDSQGLGTISNDDNSTLSIADVSIAEGDNGVSTATFVLTLSRPMPTPVTFNLATSNATATAGSDYVARSQIGRVLDAGRTRAVFEVTVNGDAVSEGEEAFNVTLNNVVGAALGDGSAVGTLQDDDAAVTPIARIQGSGEVSPLTGEGVTSEGVVTAITDHGFFLQSAEEEQDLDPATSEGVFVASADRSISVGDVMRVQGLVREARMSDDPNQLTLTLIAANKLSVLGHDTVLPRAIALDASNAGAGQALFGLERLEGMRVAVSPLNVVAPVGGSVDESTGHVRSDGRFYGVVEGVDRPFLEPGIDVLERVPALGGVNPPRFDGNPERLLIDSLGQRGARILAADVGDVITGLVGVLGYGNGVFRLLPDPSPSVHVASGANPRPVTIATDSQATIGSFNLRRFLAAPRSGNEPVLGAAAYATRLAKTANAICTYVRSPAILGVIEVEDGETLNDLAAAVNSQAGNVLFPGSCARDSGYLAHVGATVPGSHGLGFLVSTAPVRPGVPRVEVRSISSQGSADTFTQVDGSRETLFESPPLLLQARINGAKGEVMDVTVIASQLSALDGQLSDPGTRGWPTRGDYLRAKRIAQVTALARLIQAQQRNHPQHKLVVLGDFDASEFSDGHADLMGVITGREEAPGRVLRHVGSPVDPALTNLTRLAPPRERYSISREGSAQMVDHILVNQILMAPAFEARVEMARINADFGEDNYDDAAVPMRVSDHDPAILYLQMR